MSSNLATILSGDSKIRDLWLPVDSAIAEVLAFKRRYGAQHYLLACYAAFPLIVTPELVNLIRHNFLGNERVPWFADFLLSELCEPLGRGFYRVEPQIREVLLIQLQRSVGLKKLHELATFLLSYTLRRSALLDHLSIDKTHEWIALSYLDPGQVVSHMLNLLATSTSSTEDVEINLAEQLRVVNMAEVISEQLQNSLNPEEYQFLLENSRALAYYWYFDQDSLRDELRHVTPASEAEEVGSERLLQSVVKRVQSNTEGNSEAAIAHPLEASNSRHAEVVELPKSRPATVPVSTVENLDFDRLALTRLHLPNDLNLVIEILQSARTDQSLKDHAGVSLFNFLMPFLTSVARGLAVEDLEQRSEIVSATLSNLIIDIMTGRLHYPGWSVLKIKLRETLRKEKDKLVNRREVPLSQVTLLYGWGIEDIADPAAPSEFEAVELEPPDVILRNSNLNRLEHRVLELTMQGYTASYIGHLLHYSAGHVQLIRQRARIKIRATLGATSRFEYLNQ